jgi:hypothetical protein
MSLREHLSAASLSVLTSCAGSPQEQGSPAPAPPPSASALVGAVRALETLQAIRPEGVRTELRALEADTLIDPETRAELVRVLVHVTVYSPSLERSYAALEELRAALGAEASAHERLEFVAVERAQQALAVLGTRSDPRTDCVSVSEVIRAESRPGRPAPLRLAAPLEAASETVLSYVQRQAQRAGLSSVAIRPSESALARRVHEVRCRIRPEDVTTRCTLAEIGAFAAELEGRSPAASLTRLFVERSQHEPDLQAERGWWFETELALRVPAR